MMSFILDALNKSEQGRRQQQKEVRKRKVFSFSGKRRSRRRVSSWWWLSLLVIVLCVLTVLGVFISGNEPQVEVAENQPDELRSRIVRANLPAVDKEELAPFVPAAAAAPQIAPPSEPAPVPRPASRQAAAETVSDIPEPLPVAQKIHSYAELLRIRPGLQVSMHYYSPDARKSILRLNGVLLHEQESSADGLLISRITADGALVKYAGLLYELRRPGS